jgi:adenosylhomocysteine nucleosidase
MVWQMILRDVVQRAARQALNEQVARAAVPAGEASGADDSTPKPCRVGFVFALGIESGGTEDLLQNARHTRAGGLKMIEGTLAGERVVIVQSGVGREAAARGAALLIAGHQPEWIVSTGLAGGLHADVARGDFLLANAIVGSDGARCVLGDNALAVAIGPDLRLASEPAQVHVGTLLTVDRPIRLADEKRALGEKHQALAVDMESLAVAEVCVREQTRLMSLRIISDAVGDELPAEIEKLLEQKSAARRAGAAVSAILNRPGSLSELLKLKEQALVASDQLAKVLSRLVECLPPAGNQSSG